MYNKGNNHFCGHSDFFSSSLTLPPNDDNLSSAVHPWTYFILQVRNPGSLSPSLRCGNTVTTPLASITLCRIREWISCSHFRILTVQGQIYLKAKVKKLLHANVNWLYFPFFFLFCIMYLIMYLSFLLTSNVLTFLESRHARTIIETPLTNLFMYMLALAWQWQVWCGWKHS